MNKVACDDVLIFLGFCPSFGVKKNKFHGRKMKNIIVKMTK